MKQGTHMDSDGSEPIDSELRAKLKRLFELNCRQSAGTIRSDEYNELTELRAVYSAAQKKHGTVTMVAAYKHAAFQMGGLKRIPRIRGRIRSRK